MVVVVETTQRTARIVDGRKPNKNTQIHVRNVQTKVEEHKSAGACHKRMGVYPDKEINKVASIWMQLELVFY